MTHKCSRDDEEFRRSFEAFEVPADDFNHKAHVRLAYVYLCGTDPDQAATSMKRSLLAFLQHLGVDSGKYHETITRAWIRAVHHFMVNTAPCSGFEAFIERNPLLLDSNIMLSHYSAAVLFSERARSGFVEPDVSPIPEYGTRQQAVSGHAHYNRNRKESG